MTGIERRRLTTKISILSVLAFLSCFSSGALAAEIVRVKVKAANTRLGPGTRFEKVWTAPMNYPYQVLKRKGRWLRVRDFDGYQEWIYRPLTDGKPAVVVKVKKANIRKRPTTKSPITFRADRGLPFRVLRKKGRWIKVRHADGDQGWIFERLVWGATNAKLRR
ncbi:MAG: SH3 domain-containing protein [Nitrospinota bacterium]